MQPNGAASPHSSGPPGLPPVEPPSGRFLAQLFLVPLLIVSVLVLLALAGLWWSRGRYAPDEGATGEHFVRELQSENADVWWRGAHELAQVIKRPESLALASSPRFALDLADKLRQELADLERAERALASEFKGRPAKEQKDAWLRLRPQRDRVLFLIAALGDFTVPAGVPLLGEIALKEQGPDLQGLTLRRRRAVWSLANLGQNRKRWRELPAEQQAGRIRDLTVETAGKGPRARAARLSLDSLTRDEPLGVDAILARCAQSEDTYLRALVAMALNFWEGPLVEPTLERLCRDDGHGTRLEITEGD